MKIMKKSFSFVCCLFLAVSCFSPFASAYAEPMHDGEHCYFELAANTRLRLSTYRGNWRGTWGAAFGVFGERNHCPWFTADKRGDRYRLLIGAPLIGRPSNALDQRWDNSVVYVHPAHDNTNQLWGFVPAPRHPYYRIQNVGRGEYLTFNPGDQRVYGYTWSDSNNQIWIKH